jgi:very-short-patch-repair endonuclease
MTLRSTIRARALRKDMTNAERLLWRALRGHRLAGLHIRRPAPCGPFIADFFCNQARLVIEVDGATHSRDEEARRDARRDAWLVANGYRVLRVQNADIHENFAGVIETILANVEHG